MRGQSAGCDWISLVDKHYQEGRTCCKGVERSLVTDENMKYGFFVLSYLTFQFRWIRMVPGAWAGQRLGIFSSLVHVVLAGLGKRNLVSEAPVARFSWIIRRSFWICLAGGWLVLIAGRSGECLRLGRHHCSSKALYCVLFTFCFLLFSFTDAIELLIESVRFFVNHS